jgi:predicted phage terminase large subunit-like protein
MTQTNDDPVARALSILKGAQHSLLNALEDLDEDEAKASAELAALDTDAARLDLFEFVQQGWHVLEPFELEATWHHDAICKNVQGMLEEWLHHRDDKLFKMRWHKLLLNICPSSLKSRIIMVFAVAWMWLRCPSFQWLCVSANPANVTRDAEACRDLVTSRWYRETFHVTWTIRDDIDAKAKFATTAGGVRISRGLIAKFTGIHVDGILIDDPDDAHDVHSEASRRERAGKIESISSRLNDKRYFVMVHAQQRVHVDDSTGDLLSRGGCLHASYPLEYKAEWRHDSPFFADPRAVEGENLHELRFTAEVISEARRELGTHGFEAQYNQNPAPLEGGMFQRQWFRFFRISGTQVGPFARPRGCSGDEAITLEHRDGGRLDLDDLAITVDATFGSVNDSASAVGLTVIGIKGVRRFVLEDRTKPMTFVETKVAIRQLLRDYPQVGRVLVEKKANGAAVIEDLELEFAGFIPLEVDGGKTSRAYAMSAAIEAGTVYLLEGSSWLDEWVAELCVFDHGKRDDRVDALSQLMAYFRESTAMQKLEAKNAAFKSLAARMHR